MDITVTLDIPTIDDIDAADNDMLDMYRSSDPQLFLLDSEEQGPSVYDNGYILSWLVLRSGYLCIGIGVLKIDESLVVRGRWGGAQMRTGCSCPPCPDL